MFVLPIILLLASFASGRNFNNPVLDGADYPDPGVILHDGLYYAVTTANGAIPEKFPIHTSKDLQNWEFAGYIFNASNSPAWAHPDQAFWAPEIHKIGERFVVYFTATSAALLNVLCLGVASSDHILGPYTPQSKSLLAYPGNPIIDPSIINTNGSLLLMFVHDYFITLRNLTDDGLSVRDNIDLKLFKAKYDWEGIVNEGPWYLTRNGFHYIFYSVNDFCTDKYAVGVARSNVSVRGPYEKYPQPILVSDDRFKGPGHGSIVKDVDGTSDVLVHHAWKAGAVCNGGPRVMFSTTLEWGEDDWPKQMIMT